MGNFPKFRLVVHGLLAIYAAILAYILLGLIYQFDISADIFFDLSFALLFFALGQAFYEMGIKKAIVFIVISAVVGFAAEVLGTSTGFPFGQYYYTDFLGPKALGVPYVVPLVWFVIAYLAFSIAQSAFIENKRRLITTAALAAFGAVSWDFLVDPMFSSYGYWVWTKQYLPLPKLSGIPLTNFVGWFVLVALMISVFLLLVPKGGELILRPNTFDSRLVYLLLMIDGIVANSTLGNWLVIIIGVFSMALFLAISLYNERKHSTIVSRTNERRDTQTTQRAP